MTANDEFDDVELQALLQRARELPREIAANPAAWENIRKRVDETRVRALAPSSPASSVNGQAERASEAPLSADGIRHRAGSSRGLRAWLQSPRGAALLAATLFIAVTTVVVTTTDEQRTLTGNAAPLAEFAADTLRADMFGVFARYDGATTDLANDLERRRSRLNPTAVAVLDSCLNTINEAIYETRTALRDAPDNTIIAELLEVTYQHKLDLLRRASELSEGTFQE